MAENSHSKRPAGGVPEKEAWVQEARRPSPWLTVPEAAKYARCGKNRIYDACRTGELKARQGTAPHGTWSIHIDDLDTYLRPR